MGIELLNEDGFGLKESRLARGVDDREDCSNMLTSTFALQRVVRLWIRVPETPGGFNPSMACKPASSSATAEVIVLEERNQKEFSSISAKCSCRRSRSDSTIEGSGAFDIHFLLCRQR